MRTSNVDLLAEIDALAQMSGIESHDLEIVKHMSNLEGQVESMAMLIRTLIVEKQCVRNAKKYLIDNNLQGNPLR